MMGSMSSMTWRLSMWRRKEESSFTTLTLMTVQMTPAGTGTSGTMGTGSGTSPSTCRTAMWSEIELSKIEDDLKLFFFQYIYFSLNQITMLSSKVQAQG